MRSGAPEIFGELNRRRGLRSLFETFDASNAILSAQYDGLDMEDQLTCGERISHDTVIKIRHELLTISAAASSLKCGQRS